MGRERPRQPRAQESAETLVHQPFRVLKQHRPRPRAAAPVAKPAPPPPPVDGPTLFLDAVAGVTPLRADERERVARPLPASPARPITPPDAEALAELCDLVTGNVPFDVSDSDEHVEGAVVGIDPRLLRRLRGGEYAYQAHLDLHGMISEEARVAVDSFLTEAFQSGKRCVLIIHGRGRNSKDQVPVLKSRLLVWLARGRWKRLILAFTSARACDGGTGALYVLLRRRRDDKHPIRVTTGAKW